MRSLLLIACIAVVAGCTSPPTDFYTLRPTVTATEGAPVQDSGLRVGLEPVSVAGFLERPELVTVRGDGAVDVAATEAWAAPMDEMVTLVLAEDLASALGVDQVFRLPSRRILDLDRVVEVTIVALNAVGDDQVEMTALWRVFDDRDELLRHGRTSVTADFVPGETAAEQVTALSAVFAELAPTIANAVRASS